MEMSEEDVYQTLHTTRSVKNPNPTHEPVRSCRIKTVLMVFNTLLLIVILILIGIFTAKYQKSTGVPKPQDSSGAGPVLDEKKEAWLLYDDSFYLIYEAEGNCTEAAKFCRARGPNIRLAVLTPRNQDWLIAQAKGRRLLVAEDDCLTRCKLIGEPKLLETTSIPGGKQGWA
ncbi:hypothetical protein MHYP_G00284610 [Metynnis hypsauchen]